MDRRRRWGGCLGVAVCLLLAPVAVELGLRVGWSDGVRRHGYFPDQPMAYDAVVGWHHKPNHECLVRMPDFEVRLQTNSAGFRSSAEFVTAAAGEEVLAILGDGITEAFQVAEPETFCALLADRLAGPLGLRQVQNYGVGATGPPHQLQVYRHHARPHRPSRVLLAVYANDFGDASETMNAPPLAPRYQRDGTGTILDVAPFDQAVATGSSEGLKAKLRPLASYRFLAALRARRAAPAVEPLPDKYRFYLDPLPADCAVAWDNLRWCLDTLADEVAGDGARLYVALLPGRETVDGQRFAAMTEQLAALGRPHPEQLATLLAGWAGGRGVPFRDTQPALLAAYSAGAELWFSDDHLTPAGHEVVARELADWILTDGADSP